MADDVGTRLISLLGATSLHVAVGLALLSPFASGVPRRGLADGDRGRVLALELIPLDQLGEAAAPAAPMAGGPPHEDLASVRTAPSSPGAAAAITAGPAGAADSTGLAVPGDSAAAPASADLPSAELLAYRARLQAHLARYRIWPASEDGQRPLTVVLHFEMNSDGSVVDVFVESSSGASAIDEEALAAVMRAQPLPAFPIGWPSRLGISVPVRYRRG